MIDGCPALKGYKELVGRKSVTWFPAERLLIPAQSMNPDSAHIPAGIGWNMVFPRPREDHW